MTSLRFKILFQLRPWQRHSLVLSVGGLVYVLVGVSFLLMEETTPARERSLYLALSIFRLEVWAALFILAGLCSLLSARWPTFSDSWGYMVLTGLAAGWSSMYLFGYLLGYSPRSNLNATLVWGLLAFMWWAISGLRNPSPIQEVVDDPD